MSDFARDESRRSHRSSNLVPKILNGGLAGVIGISCVFPIDLIKTRLQNQQVLLGCGNSVQYTGIIDCAKKTWTQSGGGASHNALHKLTSFYSGSGVNILLITPEKAIKFVANDVFRQSLTDPKEKKLSALKGMLAGGGAGFCQTVVTTPMELIKIQMQMHSTTSSPPSSSSSAWRFAAAVFKRRGIRGLYKGLGPTMARDVTFSVFFFPLFATLEALGPRKADGSGDAVFYASFFAGLCSGAAASFICTPLDVIKTRLQMIDGGSVGAERGDFARYSGINDAFLKILKHEGPRALFKGALCVVLVISPLFGIAQTVYHFGIAEHALGLKKNAHI